VSFMTYKKNHPDQDQLIEYFYGESPNPFEIKDHLRECRACHERFLDLKRDMASISDHFKRGFWRTQRQGIMTESGRIHETKDVSWAKWLIRPAFVAIIVIILFVGIYTRLNHTPVRYTEKDISEEILLEHVAELADQPLTSSLDFLDFREEEDTDDQETAFDYSLDKLDLFGYWPELGA
jgi:hypothetical protein